MFATSDIEKPGTRLSDVAKQRATGPDVADSEAKQLFPVSIRLGRPTPRVDLGWQDLEGKAVSAACSVCHETRPPNRSNKQTSNLNEFHQGLTFSHNELSCLSCHNPENYNTLRLADGSTVEFTDVMRLCGQCHGPQFRDFQHGAHGGMTGYWDLTRGPRERNNCIDCHHPHHPQFPKMQPTFKPRDRGLTPATEHGSGSH